MRPIALAVCAFGLLIALGACSGGGDDDKTIEQRSPTPTEVATTDQQKPNSSQTPRGMTPPAEEEITREQLSAVPLTLDDLPIGWTIIPPPREDEDGDTDFCGVMRAVDPAVEVGATFRKAELGPFLTQRLMAFPNGAAVQIMADLREVVQSCNEWTLTEEDGTEMTYRIAPLSFPKFGDETIAFRTSTMSTGLDSIEIDVEIDMIIMRRGDVINQIGHSGFGPEGIDSQQTEVFAQLADEKLRRIE